MRLDTLLFNGLLVYYGSLCVAGLLDFHGTLDILGFLINDGSLCVAGLLTHNGTLRLARVAHEDWHAILAQVCFDPMAH